MGLFGKNAIADNAGIRRVTVYFKFDAPFVTNAESITQTPMDPMSLVLLMDKISDRNLVSKIKTYMHNYEVIVKGKTDMPRFKTQSEFESYVSKEFPGCRDANIIETTMAFYLIAAEMGEPDRSLLLSDSKRREIQSFL